MSPYQQQVIDASLAEFDRNAANTKSRFKRCKLFKLGAYGGGREGVMASGSFKRSRCKQSTTTSTIISIKDFNKHKPQEQQTLEAQQGLGTYQQQIGQANQGYDQAVLDATQIANREAQFQPFTQIGLIGQQLHS